MADQASVLYSNGVSRAYAGRVPEDAIRRVPDSEARLQALATSYCTCGWLNPLRVGKPECDVHALLASESSLVRLLNMYSRRAALIDAEFGMAQN